MAIYKTLLNIAKRALQISGKYFIPVLLLANRFLQTTATTLPPLADNMIELAEKNETDVNSPLSSLAHLLRNSEIIYQQTHNATVDSALLEYLDDYRNTYDYIVSTNTSAIAKKPIPTFFDNKSAFCQAGTSTLIKDANDCRQLDAQKINRLYKDAQNLVLDNNVVAAINFYNEVLRLIPSNDPYYNPLYKQLYWHLGSSHFLIRNLEQAKRCFEIAIALATDAKHMGMIYSKYGLTLNMLEKHEQAYLAHLKAYELMPDNQDVFQLLKVTEQAVAEQKNNFYFRPAGRI